MTISVQLTTGTSSPPGAVFGQSTSANNAPVNIPRLPDSAVTGKRIEDALFGYLQGMRALGHTKVDVNQASRALGLSVTAVLAAARALQSKGVQVG